MLLALHATGLAFRVWEGKERVSSRARFDREKAARKPKGAGLPLLPPAQRGPVHTLAGKPSAGAAPATGTGDGGDGEHEEAHGDAEGDGGEGSGPAAGVSLLSDMLHQARPFGTARTSSVAVRLSLHSFFAGEQRVDGRISLAGGRAGFARLLGFSVVASLDRPLLDAHYRRALNPLSIHLRELRALPALPVPLSALDALCDPVFAVVATTGLRSLPLWARPGPRASAMPLDVWYVVLLGLCPPGDRHALLSRVIVEVSWLAGWLSVKYRPRKSLPMHGLTGARSAAEARGDARRRPLTGQQQWNGCPKRAHQQR
jgi:hypothetical protein